MVATAQPVPSGGTRPRILLPIPFADDQLTDHEHGAAEVWRPSFEIEALATVPQIYLCRRTQVVPSLTRSAGGCVAPVFCP
jgi:hypothetical protein